MAFFDELFDDPALMALLAGGAIAATGGAAAPLVGAEAAGGLLADPIAAYAATGGVEGSILGSGLTGAGGSSGAVGSGTAANIFGNMQGLSNTIKPYGDAAGAAMKVKGLLSDPKQPTQQAQSTAPQVGGGQGSQTLAQIYQQGTQISPEEQARLQRKTMWG